MGLVREFGLESIWAAGKSGVRSHRSRLQGELTVTRLSEQLLASGDVPHTDVLHRVVAHVRFRPALHALEVVTRRLNRVSLVAIDAPTEHTR
jgi:hypothetical protein